MDPLFNHSLVDGDFSGGFDFYQSLVDGEFWTDMQAHKHAVYPTDGDTVDYQRPVALMADAATNVTVNYQDIMPALSDSNCILYLPFNGDDADDVWYDHSPAAHHPSVISFVTLKTAQAKFGATSAYWGSSSYIALPDHTDWAFGTDDITIMCWLYIVSGATATYLFRQYGGAIDYTDFIILSNKLTFRHDGATIVESSALTWTFGQWYHIAVTRSGNTWSVYRDGVRYGTETDATSIGDIAATPTIGLSPVLQDWHIDDYVITKQALYTGAIYTVPTTNYGFSDIQKTQYARVSYSLYGAVSDVSDLTEIIVDASGALAGPVGNQPKGEVLAPIAGAKFRLTWLYDSLNQPAVPTGFKVYNRTTGAWSLQTTVAALPGRSRYSYTTGALSDGTKYDYQVRTYRTITNQTVELPNQNFVSGFVDSSGPTAVTGLVITT